MSLITEPDEDNYLPPPVMVTMPCGEDYFVCRALVRDSWLQWVDALPPDQGDWHRLTDPIVTTVQELARALHYMHRSLPSYKRCDEKPFTVTRWWDPDADDGWETGGHCLFRFTGLSSDELIDTLPRKSQLPWRLRLIKISENFVEASLE